MKHKISLTFESFRDGLFEQEITIERRIVHIENLSDAINSAILDVYANITEIGYADSRLIGVTARTEL